jgi:hypothetical protein
MASQHSGRKSPGDGVLGERARIAAFVAQAREDQD